MIRRTGLAPWEFKFPFPGSLTCTVPRRRMHDDVDILTREGPDAFPRTTLQRAFRNISKQRTSFPKSYTLCLTLNAKTEMSIKNWGAGCTTTSTSCSGKALTLSRSGTYRGTSLIRNSAPPGPYSGNMSRALWWSWGGGRFLMSEVPL